MKKLFTILVLMLILGWANVNADGWSGSGNLADPYQIITAAKVATLATDVNGGSSYSGSYFKLMNNISLSAYASWTPIGKVDDVTCVAQWQQNTSTISFDSDGGTAVAPINQTEGTAVTAPADPTKTGYTFTGWSPTVPATMPVDDVTCVAQWVVNVYSAPELMYYKFNATGNQTNYACTPVGNNPAQLVGQTIGNTGQFGTALIGNELPSTTNRLNTGWATNLPSTGWTISFWVNNFPSTSPTTRYYFGDATTGSFRCFTGGVAPLGGLIIRGTGLTDVPITNIPSTPTVIHLVYTGSAVKVYLNGVYNSEVAQSSVSFSGTGPFLVGGYSSSTSFNAGTLMDEFRIYNRALDATEIAATWNIELTCGTTPPTVTTQAVNDIAATTATGNGNITSLGVPNPTAYGVCWNTGGTPTTSDSKVDKGAASATGAFTAAMTNLSANTTYHVRAFATNSVNTSYGTDVSFTTSAIAPIVTTQAVNDIAATTATGNGNITSLGVPNPTAYGVCWNTGGTPTTTDSKVDKGAASVTGAFTAAMTNLSANTTYHVRAFATNTANTSYGTDVSFTTLVVAPVTQASAIVFSSVQTTQMTISWTNGNGSKRAVFVKEGSGSITNPTDNTTYTASANWASKGTELGSSGYYCVYNNNSNTFTLTGLSSATQYTVQIFEYNGAALGEKYNVTTATNNPKSQTSNSLIKYVDASKVDDSGDGFTWASAKKYLQSAIDLSVSGDQVWIKAGTYIPTTEAGGTGTRYKTFTLKEGVPIYGGFAGTETSLTERVVKNNPTILSGDLSGNDNYTVTPWTNTTENAYHVIYMPGTLNLTTTVILDGLIISGGNANETLKGGLHATYGGGMFFEGSPSNVNSVNINNCILRNNHAINGGAIYTLITSGGGAFEPTFTNCLIYSNNADNGGAYAGSGFCQLYFYSCTFTGNTALTYGGAFYSAGYSMQYFYNSIFWNNTASIGKQFYITMPNGKSAGGCFLTNCCYAYETNDVVYSPNWASFLFNSTDGITTDPQFINPVTADYRIYGTSPCVNAGLNGHNNETKDIRGETRVQNTTIDIGAYEWTNGIDPASSCENAITVTNNNSSGAGSFQQALLDLCEGGTITLNLAVEWPNNITITKNLTLDLHGYSFSNTGNYTALIDDGKAIGIKNTASGGSFNVKIAFAATSSTLALYSESVIGSGFSVSATSPASGLLQIGDGTTSITHTYTTSDPKFNGKISKIVVKNSSSLILNPPLDKK